MISRSSKDVAYDLLEEEPASTKQKSKRESLSRIILASLLAALLVGAIQAFFIKASLPAIIIPTMVIAAIGVIVDGRYKEFVSTKIKSDIEYFIPIVMERLVMAVEAGQDIIPAIKAIVDLEERAEGANAGYKIDPVTNLLKRVVGLAENGMAFDEALKETSSDDAMSPALKHAFVHMGIAFKEGGELIAPLRELSDATQLYYQETVEEEIAKLPVKATLPLVCTFAGLMIFFLASPLVQILNFTMKAAPK